MSLKLPLRLAAALCVAGLGVAATRSHSAQSTASAPSGPKAVNCDLPADAGMPWSGHPVQWRLQPVPGAKPGSFEEVSRVLSRADWQCLDAGRRNLVRRQLRYAREGRTPLATCFAPGTNPDVVRSFRKLELALSPFRQNTRWTRTATTSSVSLGGPMVLTWNIVADGTPLPNEFSADPTATVPSDLQAFAAERLGSVENLRQKFRSIFARYEELSGIRYVEVAEDDGARTRDNAGELGVRADIRIGGTPIDGTFGILAYNYFPNSGDMVIDTSDELFSDTPTPLNPSPDLLLRNTLAHEHGHGLGLMHTCPLDNTKLMEPFLNQNFDGPQLDDIIGLQSFYGDTFESPAVNNTRAAAADLGTLPLGTKTINDLSIGSGGDNDFYKFQTDAAGRTLLLSLTVPGSPYDEGPQASDGSCGATSVFNPTNRRNLALRVMKPDGTILGEANNFPAGQGETVGVADLPGTGPFLVRVYGTDGTDRTQLYNLNFSLQDTSTEGIATVSGRCVSIFANSGFNGSARKGLTGARVFLKNSGGEVVATTETNSNGDYGFSKVPSGSYSMTAEFDKDAETVMVMDPPVRGIQVGATDLTVPRFALYSIFGFVRAPDKQGDIQPVGGAEVKLFNPKGVEIGSVTTGSDGKYEFRLQRAATFTLRTTRANLLFPEYRVTTPTSGLNWSPATRRNIVGQRAATVAGKPSGASS